MIDAGILTPNEKVELLEGQIVQMSPQKPPHAATTQKASDCIKTSFVDKAHVRTQLPITLSSSEPEPDIAVVRLDAGEYGDRHPSPEDIFLLIEVAYTTLAFDRFEKAPIYARANISEYWILDVVNRQVFVFRHPGEDGYGSEIVFDDEATLISIAFPEVKIAVSDLFLPKS